MNRKSFVIGAVLLSGLLMASHAGAFTIWTCNGNPMVWEDPFVMLRHKPSIPTGSAAEGAFVNAVDRWNGVIGMDNMVSISPLTTSGSVVTTGDGLNEAAVTNRIFIGGNNGLTLMKYSLCVFSSSWGEADVFVANDLTFGHVPEDLLTSTSGRSTFMHEFGHAHGLDHHQRFNNMRVPQPRPVVGGPNETVDALPDDANGGRFLYPNGNKEVNLFASAFRKTSKDKIVLNHTGTITSCSTGGGSVTLNSTVGNNGTVSVTQTERWWVSTSANAHSGGTQIFQWNNSTFPAGKTNQRQVTFKMPALPVGTYFLYHGVDALKDVDESREDDNAVREGLKIKVTNC